MFLNSLKSRCNVLKVASVQLKNYRTSATFDLFKSRKLTPPAFPHNNSIYRYCPSLAFSSQIDPLKFDEVCEETLESLCEYFEELIENNTQLKGADVTYGDGVLTVMFGDPYGTYVINRQTPNKQIWLSSPTSGPKRYDFDSKNEGCWIYKHDGVSLHQLLQQEIDKIVENKADFKKCSYSFV